MKIGPFEQFLIKWAYRLGGREAVREYMEETIEIDDPNEETIKKVTDDAIKVVIK